MSKQNGFTLLELMVVVAIVGILAAVALPAYNNYVLRAYLGEARALLESNRVRMEQFFQDNRTYATACNADFPVGSRIWNITCGSVDLDIAAPTAGTYTLVATPAATAPASLTGFAFTINEAQARVTVDVPGTGDWAANGNCWVTRPGGIC